jgi:hypothetical protein
MIFSENRFPLLRIMLWRAFSSELDTGSREENASKQEESRASVLIQSEPKMLWTRPHAAMLPLWLAAQRAVLFDEMVGYGLARPALGSHQTGWRLAPTAAQERTSSALADEIRADPIE